VLASAPKSASANRGASTSSVSFRFFACANPSSDDPILFSFPGDTHFKDTDHGCFSIVQFSATVLSA
jgi:hypothetical protein